MQVRRPKNRRRVEDLGAPNQTSATTHAVTAPSSSTTATSTTSATTAPSFSTATSTSSTTTAPSSSTATSTITASSAATASASSSPAGTTSPSSVAAQESNLLRINIPQEPPKRDYNRPLPLKEPCLVCFEGRSTPPTLCCNKPLCNKCLDSWLNQRRVTCPHCRERLPNELVVRNMEASDALLSDPDFQRRIPAVSLRFRCLCLTILRDKKFFILTNAEFQFVLPGRNPSDTMSCVRCHRKQSTAT